MASIAVCAPDRTRSTSAAERSVRWAASSLNVSNQRSAAQVAHCAAADSTWR